MDPEERLAAPSAIGTPCFAFMGDLLLLKTEPGVELPVLDDIAELHLSGRSPVSWMTGRPGDCWASLVEDAPLPDGTNLVTLRDVWSLMGERAFFEAGRAFQIMEWSQRNRFCGRCATPMSESGNETALECPACGLITYPRLLPRSSSPWRKRKLLLARNTRFQGQVQRHRRFRRTWRDLEGAVEREVMEEVSVRVKNITYFGSQPWPFPHSMMIGFRAEWGSGEIRADGNEIESAGWYSPGGFPDIPPGFSISRRLIDDFLARHA